MREAVQDIEALILLRRSELSTEQLVRLRVFLDTLIRESPGGDEWRSGSCGSPCAAKNFQSSARAEGYASEARASEGSFGSDDDTDMTIALDEARVCEFVLTRSLTPSSDLFVKAFVRQADLRPAVQGEDVRLPRLGQATFDNNFEFCRALSLPFLDEVREELLVSFESVQFRTSPVLGVTLEGATQEPHAVALGSRARLRRRFPEPPPCLSGQRIGHHGVKVHGEIEGRDLDRLSPDSVALRSSVHAGHGLPLSATGQSRLTRFQVVLLFQPGSARISDVQRDEIAVSVDHENCYCFGILIVDKCSDFPLLCVLKGRLPCPERSSTGAPTHCMALLNCNLVSSLRIAKALGRPDLHCPQDFWRQEVLAGKVVNESPCNFASSRYSRLDIVKLWCSVLNASQKDAVLELLCKFCDSSIAGAANRVTLVQGPPGTGKTQTLAVLLDLLLHFRHRTLVCAPSNVAVAEVVQRLMRQRLVRCSTSSSSGMEVQDADVNTSCATHPSCFDCLRPGEWLDDACITHFLREMSESIPDAILLVEPPQAFLMQESSDVLDLVELALDLRLPERDLILIPVNNAVSGVASSGTHWSLLAVRPVFFLCQFEYYDSIQSTQNYSKACRLAIAIQSLVQALSDGSTPDFDQPAPNVTRMETIQQDNGNDCGIFLLEFVERLTARFPESPNPEDLLTRFDPAQKRADLHAQLGRSPPNSMQSSDALKGRLQHSRRPHHCKLGPAPQELVNPSVSSLAEMALVANESTAGISWGDVRSRVLIKHRAKRIKRVAQFWLGDGRGSVKPYLEQPPWVEKGGDPLSGLLCNPRRAWTLWRERKSTSSKAQGPGNLCSAWSGFESMTEDFAGLREFLVFALNALGLVADRQLAELQADVPLPSVRPFLPKSSEGQAQLPLKWAKALAAYRDIVHLQSILLDLRVALETFVCKLEALPQEGLLGIAESPSFTMPAQSKCESQQHAGHAQPNGPSNATEASAEHQKLVINAVLEAVRGSISNLAKLLDLDIASGRQVTEQQLKSARRRLHLLTHPDKAPDGLGARATEAFKFLPQAWQKLERACRGVSSAIFDEFEDFNAKGPDSDFAPSHWFQHDALTASNKLYSVAQEMRKMSLFVCSAGCSTIQRALLQRCALIFCTLSVSGRPLVREQCMPSVVVDEACQSTEALSLVPLHEDVEHMLLVGDPQQLPPTVKSRFAEGHNYGSSTFERVLRSGQTPRLLAVQYRMHPDILEWPNTRNYGGQVSTSDSVLRRDANELISEHGLPEELRSRYGPMRIFDTSGEQCSEEHHGHSICNPGEAEFLLRNLQMIWQYCTLSDALKIGIISPYKAQVNLIQNLLAKSEYDWLRAFSKVSTVDGFQGKECDIIAISCVRTGETIGFVKDHRRLNVAITRAKLKSWIFGNLNALERGAPVWEDLGCFVRERGWVVSASLASPSPQRFGADSKNAASGASVDGTSPDQRTKKQGMDTPDLSDITSETPAGHGRGAPGAIWQVLQSLPLHKECLVQSQVATTLTPGVRCIQLESTVLADGFVWIHVQMPDVQGWVALESEHAASITQRSCKPKMEIVLDVSTVDVRTKDPILTSMDPFQIRFTHDCISSKFSNGTPVDDAIVGILSGTIAWSAFPPMCVTKNPGDGCFYSLSNRRLFLCRVLANHGALSRVDVNLYPFDSEVVQKVKDGQPKWIRSFSTRVSGKYVRVVSSYERCQWPRRPNILAESPVECAQFGSPPSQGSQSVRQPSPMVDKDASCVSAGECREGEMAELTAELSLVTRLLPVEGSESSRRVTLNVSPTDGAGLDLWPTRWGMMVAAIDANPGQSGIAVGDTITQIRDQSLVGISETVEKVFGSSFEHGVQLLVANKVEARFPVPADDDLSVFEQDLHTFAERLEVDAKLEWTSSQAEVVVHGPRIAFRAAQEELEHLFHYYFQTR